MGKCARTKDSSGVGITLGLESSRSDTIVIVSVYLVVKGCPYYHNRPELNASKIAFLGYRVTKQQFSVKVTDVKRFEITNPG